MASGHQVGGDHSEGGGHILPFAVYRNSLLALLVLTVVTVGAARVDFGSANFVVALIIASIKAGIVALYFMHLRYESPLIWLFAFFPVFLLGLLLAGVFIDQPLRTKTTQVTVQPPE